jgi:hypothetical protein
MVERVEVVFEPIPLLRSGLVAPRIRSIRLVRPQLKARFDGRRFTFGSLQPLVDEFTARPGVGPGPTVVIENGGARLSTPMGLLRLAGDGRLDRGRLDRLDLRLEPTRLSQQALRIDVLGGRLLARTEGRQIAASLGLRLGQVVDRDLRLTDVQADATGRLPYAAALIDGPVRFSLTAKATQLRSKGVDIRTPIASLNFDGSLAGPLERVRLAGGGGLSLSAGAWTIQDTRGERLALTGGLSSLRLARSADATRLNADLDLSGGAGPLRLAGFAVAPSGLNGRLDRIEAVVREGAGTVTATPRLVFTSGRLASGASAAREVRTNLSAARAELAWSKGGWSLAGPLAVEARAATLVQPVPGGDIALRNLVLGLTGQSRTGSAGTRLDLAGAVRSSSGGASPAAARTLAETVPIIGSDPAGKAAIERFVRTVRLDAPSVRLQLDPRGFALHLPRPLQLTGADGGSVTLAAPTTGTLSLRMAGGGLPELTLEAPRYRTGSDRGGLTFTADSRVSLTFSGETMRGATLLAAPRLSRSGGVISVALPACGALAIASFGEAARPLLTNLEARVCADAGRPLLTLADAWRFRTEVRDIAFRAPESEALIRQAKVQLEMSGSVRSSQPVGSARIADARVLDAAGMRRFEPLSVRGEARLAGDVWSGPLQVFTAAKNLPVAEVRFSHVVETSRGHADISAPRLAFTADALQPRDLSPVGVDMISDVEGAVSFTGQADWGEGDLKSSGRLTAAGLDFRSPLGMVKQARADIALVSLAPMISAPGQTVSADEIAWIAPLEAPAATLTIKEDRIQVETAGAGVATGRVTLDPLELSYDPAATTSGTLRLDDIDVGVLIGRFNLADKVMLEAKIDGVLPFAMSADTLRFANGRVFAIEPGRLTVRREALTGASASTADAAVAANGVQNFAYQALENLAFDKLEAEVGSQPQGRLGILFRVNGRHDPPTGGQTRLSVFDLLRGRAFDKPIDLPKGTPVNLTLDTSLNLDELLAAYSGRSRSEPVQTPAGKP